MTDKTTSLAKEVRAFRTTTADNGDFLTEMPNITRVELWDYCGPIDHPYSNWNAKEVSVSVQDGGRTLKVFVGKSA